MAVGFGKPFGLFLIGLTILLQACDGGSFDDTSTNNSIYAPSESPHKIAYFRYEVPPSGFTAVLGWMQAIDIEGNGLHCKVEVDWMRIHAVVYDIDIILYEDTFDNHIPAMDYFGLYNRNPWFDGDRLADMPFTIENGNLVVEPSLHPQRVFHWWNTSRSLVLEGTSWIWFEARIRVTGGAGVQAGIDYWKDLDAPYAGPEVNNTEAGVSDWFGNSTDDWQIIGVGRL